MRLEEANMGELRVMGRGGDTKLSWNAENVAEVENARRTFEELVTVKGFAAWSVKGRSGEKDKRITAFDPEAERILIVPPMVGGG